MRVNHELEKRIVCEKNVYIKVTIGENRNRYIR